jgi:ABC-2 type transport system permease protein/lipopolysaccharide transport system permease protein
VIEGLRDTVLLGNQPDWTLQIVGGISALIVLATGYYVFKRLETGIADIA